MAADRRQPRLPISLEVQYRTAGAFLVSYSVNLSKGGLFLETNTPLEPGEHVSLSFDVPGVGPLEAEGVVAWVRTGSPDGLPDGMGIQFDALDARYGEIIDELVRDFVGLTVLVIAASPDRLALIGRYVRAIIAGICLIPPTLLMGATLPAISRWVETTPRGVSWLGFFYGGNIAGAVIGSLVAGFYLMRVYDISITTFAAVALNVLVALVGLGVAKSTSYTPSGAESVLS